MIRLLLDRIDLLEKQFQALKSEKLEQWEFVDESNKILHLKSTYHNK